MKRSTNIIWRNKLENFIKTLYLEQRKNCMEIVEIIKKEKGISISRESIRKFINDELFARN